MAFRTIRIRRRGAVTLPADIRLRYGLAEGDPLTVTDLDGAILLSPRIAMVDPLSREIEHLRDEAGLTLGDLMGGLREERA